MAAPSVADLVQTFAKGVTRPEADQNGWLPYAEDLNFVYARATGTTSQRPVGVPAGWLYYDTTIEGFVGWDGASWADVGGGSSLTEPADPADDGKVAVADGGDLTYVAVSTLAGVASTVGLKFGATTIALNSSAPSSGNLLSYNGTNFVGVAPSTLSVASASAAITSLSADYALGLTFGATDIDTDATAPTTNQVIIKTATGLAGLDPGSILRRKSSTNHSTATLVFTSNQVLLWNGSTTVSLTADLTGAVDGAEITLLFPASSMNSFALSTDIDPTGLIDDTFTSNLVAWLLRLKYHACGPCIEVLNFSQVTDL